LLGGIFEHPETIVTLTPYGKFPRRVVHKSRLSAACKKLAGRRSALGKTIDISSAGQYGLNPHR
jgi:hypothetical protein